MAQAKYNSIEEYIDTIPEDRIEPFLKLKKTIEEHIPEGFEEALQYNMPAYNVPLSTYPEGYHCDASQPLPFISIANQKNFIALYHFGMYADKELYDWFVAEYPNHAKYKLDMGKSCIRFKKMTDIPYDLVGELVQKMSLEKWVSTYEKNLKG